jgi:SGNH domain (fused to AT3 domains)
MGVSAGGTASAIRVPDQPCFGAAARDAERPCRNPELTYSVVPRPSVARKLPGAPCSSIERDSGVSVCEFGVPAREATRTIALVGDSHAGHWRGAVDAVARAKGWHGLSVTHTSCPLQKALRDLPEPHRSQCIRWKRETFRWFERHPEVSTVFVAGLTGGSGVVPRGGLGSFGTAVDSYIDAWNALPATVEQIVVIRDTPKVRADIQACVERADAQGRRADLACAQPRSAALDRDPATAAAGRMQSPRVQTVDLTRYFCDARRCYPVIGGALVCRDQNHLTALFSTTLGPFLLREVDRLVGSRPAK